MSEPCMRCGHEEADHIGIRSSPYLGQIYCRPCYAQSRRGDIHEYAKRKESVKATEVDQTSEIG